LGLSGRGSISGTHRIIIASISIYLQPPTLLDVQRTSLYPTSTPRSVRRTCSPIVQPLLAYPTLLIPLQYTLEHTQPLRLDLHHLLLHAFDSHLISSRLVSLILTPMLYYLDHNLHIGTMQNRIFFLYHYTCHESILDHGLLSERLTCHSS